MGLGLTCPTLNFRGKYKSKFLSLVHFFQPNSKRRAMLKHATASNDTYFVIFATFVFFLPLLSCSYLLNLLFSDSMVAHAAP